ncbi:hypothetical protein F5Y03DRAFT_400666 [Xylaria venustula]|nr:hypothetical protein F5Y03DRAFT_400666 [Xylaria venustula]
MEVARKSVLLREIITNLLQHLGGADKRPSDSVCNFEDEKEPSIGTTKYEDAISFTELMSIWQKHYEAIGEPDVMSQIGDLVLAPLSPTRKFSRVNVLPYFRVRFEGDRKPLDFLLKQFDEQIRSMLGLTLTLSGSLEDAQAITCKSPDDTVLFAQLLNSKVGMVAPRTETPLQRLGNNSWVAVALRPASADYGIDVCTPCMQQVQIENHLNDLPDEIQSIDANSGVSFEVCLKSEHVFSRCQTIF